MITTTVGLDLGVRPIMGGGVRAVRAVMPVARALRAAGDIDSASLYLQFSREMSRTNYEAVIHTLKVSGLVMQRTNLLTWIEPRVNG